MHPAREKLQASSKEQNDSNQHAHTGNQNGHQKAIWIQRSSIGINCHSHALGAQGAKKKNSEKLLACLSTHSCMFELLDAVCGERLCCSPLVSFTADTLRAISVENTKEKHENQHAILSMTFGTQITDVIIGTHWMNTEDVSFDELLKPQTSGGKMSHLSHSLPLQDSAAC